MAIIKTLLLQVFVFLAFLGAAQCVDPAEKPTLAFKPATDYCGQDVVSIECTATGPGTNTQKASHLRIAKDGKVISSGWQVTSNDKVTKVIANSDGRFDQLDNGDYTCEGAMGDAGQNPSVTNATLTVDCPQCGATDDCSGAKKYCKDDDPNDRAGRECICKYGGTISTNSCNECDATGGCNKDGTTPRCDSNSCVACDAHTCDADGAKPRCDSTTGGACKECTPAFCTTLNKDCDENTQSTKKGQCVDKTTSPPTQGSGGTTNKANTGDSNGTTGKGSDTTSSAGTVTSTACLVIASVVVALMN